MGCKSNCFKLCPVSLGIAVGLTAMLCMWIMMMWGAHIDGGAASAYMQHVKTATETMPLWQVYLYVFLKGFFGGFFVALFYDLCRCLCYKTCKKSSEQCGTCNCGCSCCGPKKV